ncbi:hypothetical protein [Nocardia tengchongensis]|uniref:hypothetical protein n=1 Tax=Nocardia tengchongensis TaxID=2055889 RepID=UPI0036845497
MDSANGRGGAHGLAAGAGGVRPSVDDVTKPGIGHSGPPDSVDAADECLVRIEERYVRQPICGAFGEIGREQVRDRTFELTQRELVELLENWIVSNAIGPLGLSCPELHQASRGTEYWNPCGVVEDLGEDLAVLRERHRLEAHAQMRVEPLPQHGVRDVEAVELIFREPNWDRSTANASMDWR